MTHKPKPLTGKNTTTNDSRISKNKKIAMESGKHVVERMEGSKHCSSLESGGNTHTKDQPQQNLQSKSVN